MAAPKARYVDRAAKSVHSRESENPGPKAGSPLSRGRTEEHRAATHILLRRERRFARAVLQQLAGDHHLLHLGRAFVDAQRPDLAVKLFDLDALGDAEAAVQLHGAI